MAACPEDGYLLLDALLRAGWVIPSGCHVALLEHLGLVLNAKSLDGFYNLVARLPLHTIETVPLENVPLHGLPHYYPDRALSLNFHASCEAPCAVRID